MREGQFPPRAALQKRKRGFGAQAPGARSPRGPLKGTALARALPHFPGKAGWAKAENGIPACFAAGKNLQARIILTVLGAVFGPARKDGNIVAEFLQCTNCKNILTAFERIRSMHVDGSIDIKRVSFYNRKANMHPNPCIFYFFAARPAEDARKKRKAPLCPASAGSARGDLQRKTGEWKL